MAAAPAEEKEGQVRHADFYAVWGHSEARLCRSADSSVSAFDISELYFAHQTPTLPVEQKLAHWEI